MTASSSTMRHCTPEPRAKQRVLRVVLCAIVGAAVAGCGAGDPSVRNDGWKGSIDTLPDGAIRVSNPAEGMWSDAERWTIVEEVRIGRTEGSGPDVFGFVAAVDVTPTGNIVVIDGFAQELRFFDSRGQHLRTVGRKGAGPGEFRSAYGLAWDRLGRLWVVDGGNSRYAVFDSSGNYLFDRRRTVPGVVYPWLGGFGDDGNLYDVAFRPGPNGGSVFTFFRVDTLGNVIDSLPKLEYERPGSGPLPMPLFGLMPRLTFRLDPRGHIWSGVTGEYRIVQRTLDGDTLRVIERAFAPVAVTQEENDSIRKQLAATPEFATAVIPDAKPAFDRIFPHADGYLLVQPMTRAEDSGRVFDVFDSSGRYLGPATSNVKLVTFPVLPVFTRDHVYGLMADSLGVQYVVRARIDRRGS